MKPVSLTATREYTSEEGTEPRCVLGLRVPNDDAIYTYRGAEIHESVSNLGIGYLVSAASDIETFQATLHGLVIQSWMIEPMIIPEVCFFQCGDDDTLIVVDRGESTDEFPPEQQQAVNLLRHFGRKVLADRLVTMLAGGRGRSRRA